MNSWWITNISTMFSTVNFKVTLQRADTEKFETKLYLTQQYNFTSWDVEDRKGKRCRVGTRQLCVYDEEWRQRRRRRRRLRRNALDSKSLSRWGWPTAIDQQRLCVNPCLTHTVAILVSSAHAASCCLFENVSTMKWTHRHIQS